MIDSIFILGNFVQELGIARQAKEHNLKVWILAKNNISLAALSSAVDRVVYFEDINKDLWDIFKCYQNKNTLLFPTSDEFIDFIEKHRTLLETMYTIALPNSEVVDLFANKRNAYQFVVENNIATPKSWCPNTVADLMEIANEVNYPCVIKPAVMYSFSAAFGKKAFLAKTKDELIRLAEMIAKTYPIEGILIQEFMDGGAKHLYSFGTFAIDGKSVADIQVNRIRQRPMVFGKSTTYCVSCEIPAIEEAAKKILEKTHYTGAGEIEFMYDKGEYKFLEINTRTWKWHTISNQRGFSFVGEWIKYLNGGTLLKIDRKTPVAWVEHYYDIFVWIKECIHNRLSIKEVLSTYCRKKEWAIWSWKDPLPGLLFPLVLMENKFHKHSD